MVMRVTENQSLIFRERQDYVPSAVGSIDHINLTIQASDIEAVAANCGRTERRS
jgi:hypothetical protein